MVIQAVVAEGEGESCTDQLGSEVTLQNFDDGHFLNLQNIWATLTSCWLHLKR